MHRNVYLLSFCIVILASIVITEYKNLKLTAKSGEFVEIVIDSANMANSMSVVTEVDENILIKEEEGGDYATTTSQSEKIQKNTQSVTAQAYLVGNLDTGEIYINSNSKKVFPIASVSKLYTALVVRHLFDPEQKITITPQMLKAYGNAGNLSVDEKFTPDELLYALLMESSNDAAEAYAYSFGYGNFIEQMNAFAKEIGMSSTSFKDASGLSSGNISSAEDLFTLAQYLYKSEPDILDISKTTEFSLSENSDHISHRFVNINPFSQNPNFIGGKTGRTDEAKESMISLFNKSVGENTYPIAVVVLRSDFGERETNTEKLVNMFVDKIFKNN